MGKFFVNFNKFSFPNGIDFQLITQVISSIPGSTALVSFDTSWPNNNCFKLIAENSFFEDGTEIVANYSVTSMNPVGKPSYTINVFSGVTIIDPPPTKTPIPIPLPNNPSYALPAGSGGQVGTPNGWYAPTYGIGAVTGTGTVAVQGGTYFNTGNGSITITVPNLTFKCTCGAHAVGGICSTWCDTQGLQP